MPEPKDITILLVDDEVGLRMAMAYDFKKRGFKVLEAACGRDAFEIVKSAKIDLVITDMRMPDGDGVELLDKIKELNPEIPVVIFVTGFSDLPLEDAYDKGADAVFSKPFDRKALMEIVIRVTLSREGKWDNRSSERLSSEFKIELYLPELGVAIQGKVLNIGRGGMFVSLQNNFPKIKGKVEFCIAFDHGMPKKIDGCGVVRWVRANGSDAKPSGCGIEFEHLSDQSRKQVIELINSLKTKSFIPATA